MKYTNADPNVIAKSSEKFITVSIKIELDAKCKNDRTWKSIYYTL